MGSAVQFRPLLPYFSMAIHAYFFVFLPDDYQYLAGHNPTQTDLSTA